MTFTVQELEILRQAADIILKSQESGPKLFTVTREWIHANRTKRGGWTAKQLLALGIRWPSTKGWQARAAGMQITEANRLIFESFGRGPALTGPEVPQTLCDCNVPPWEDCPHTLGI